MVPAKSCVTPGCSADCWLYAERSVCACQMSSHGIGKLGAYGMLSVEETGADPGKPSLCSMRAVHGYTQWNIPHEGVLCTCCCPPRLSTPSWWCAGHLLSASRELGNKRTPDLKLFSTLKDQKDKSSCWYALSEGIPSFCIYKPR